MTIGRSGSPVILHSEQRTAAYAVLGSHIEGPEAVFAAARMEFRQLRVWAKPQEWIQFGDQGNRRWFELDEQAVDLNQPDGQLTLRIAPGDSTASDFHDVEFHWSTRDRGRTFEELWTQLVNPLRTLLSIAVDRPSALTAMHLKLDSEDDWLELVHPSLQSVDDSRKTSPLLTVEHVTLGHVATWLANYHKYFPVPALLAASLSDDPRSIEFQVLELAAAAEGLHRRLFAGSRSLPKPRARQIRDSVLEFLAEDPEAHDAVRGALVSLGEADFRTRLEQLVENSVPVVPEVTGISPAWIQKVKIARNSFAHLLRSAEELSKQPRENYVLKQSLRWVLGTVLMLDIGVPAEVLRQRTVQSQRYQFMLQQAAGWMADVYVQDESSP